MDMFVLSYHSIPYYMVRPLRYKAFYLLCHLQLYFIYTPTQVSSWYYKDFLRIFRSLWMVDSFHWKIKSKENTFWPFTE